MTDRTAGWVGRAGAVFALLYAAVALATSALSSRPVRPLFDGFAPPVAYAWVAPPPDRAGDNVAPKSAERDFPLRPDGIEATNVATDDAQAVVGLVEGSVRPNPPDTAVKVTVEPVDPSTLAPLPAGLRAVSNAYRATLRYVPSQTEITALAAKGTVALTAAEAGDRLLFSPDAARWQELAFRPYGTDNGLFGELEAAGYFVVASSLRATAGHGSSGPDLRSALLVIAAVVPIAGAVLALRLPSPVRAGDGGRSRRPKQAGSPTSRGQRPGRKAKKRRRRRAR